MPPGHKAGRRHQTDAAVKTYLTRRKRARPAVSSHARKLQLGTNSQSGSGERWAHGPIRVWPLRFWYGHGIGGASGFTGEGLAKFLVPLEGGPPVAGKTQDPVAVKGHPGVFGSHSGASEADESAIVSGVDGVRLQNWSGFAGGWVSFHDVWLGVLLTYT